MAQAPIITFKAGKCEYNVSLYRVFGFSFLSPLTVVHPLDIIVLKLAYRRL